MMKRNNNEIIKRGAATVVAALLLTGCALMHRGGSATTEQTTDSTKITIRERVVFVPDTIWVRMPSITAERATRDTTSHLENVFAQSTASITKGTLRHDLITKPQEIALPSMTKVVYKDSIIFRDRLINHETIKEVERKYNLWDKVRFWICYIGLIYFVIRYGLKLLKI